MGAPGGREAEGRGEVGCGGARKGKRLSGTNDGVDPSVGKVEKLLIEMRAKVGRLA